MNERAHGIEEGHRQYANGPTQIKVIDCLLQGKSKAETAEVLGIAQGRVRGHISTVKRRGRRYGYDPESGATTAQYNPVKGESVLSRKVQHDDGTITDQEVLRWTKTSRTTEEMIESAKAVIDAMASDIPVYEPVVPPPKVDDVAKLLCNTHTLADYHLGMFSDSGDEPWTTELATAFLQRWFQRSIDLAPDAGMGLLLQLGDFLHFDSLIPVTPASRHVLSADVSYDKLIEHAIFTLRIIIDMMLQKYPYVHVVISEGNHDEQSAIWLRRLIAIAYGDEPRITVDTSASPYHVYEFGENAIFSHHGHKKPPAQIDHVLAGMFRKEFGRAKFSYAHLGHRHNKEITTSNLMRIEQHGTLAPKDDYATRMGYTSERSADVITYHANYGEVYRLRLSAEMVV